MKKKVLFHRHYRRFQGGHLAFWHYYRFLKGSDKYEPQVYFSKDSLWDASNPWRAEKDKALPKWEPNKADILMLGIVDWIMLSEKERDHPPCPIVHPVLASRIANPADPAHSTLRHRAIRICPSLDTADAILKTGKVNGPVFVTLHGVDGKTLPPIRPLQEKDIDILIVGLKEPYLTRELIKILTADVLFLTKKIEALTELIPRDLFLDKLSRSKITLFVPLEYEGCYLPIIEGLALQTLAVSASFCGRHEALLPGQNCLFANRSPENMAETLRRVIQLSNAEKDRYLECAKRSIEPYTMQKERSSFLEIMDHVDQIW